MVRPAGGGLTTYIRELILAWSEMGDELFVLLRTEGALELRAVRASPRVKVIVTSAPTVAAQQVLLGSIARSEHADVLFAPTPVLPLRDPGVPSVCVVHDLRHLYRPTEFSLPQQIYRRLIYLRSCDRARRVIAVSGITASGLRRVRPRIASKITVVHHGSDHVDSWPRRPSSNYGLAFAHWSNKRPELIIQAWRELAEQGVLTNLVVVGASEALRESLQRQVAALDLLPTVEIVSFQRQSAFERLFAGASVVVMSGTHEGFGLPVVEAMRLGIPVVAARDIGLEEAGGTAAIYVDPVAESIAAGVRAALEAPGRERAFDLGAQRTQSLTWRATASATRQAVRASLGGAAPD